MEEKDHIIKRKMIFCPKEESDEKIIADFEIWLEHLENPDKKNFPMDGCNYSPREIVDHIKGKTSLGKELLTTIRSLSKALGTAPCYIIKNFLDQPEKDQ